MFWLHSLLLYVWSLINGLLCRMTTFLLPSIHQLLHGIFLPKMHDYLDIYLTLIDITIMSIVT